MAQSLDPIVAAWSPELFVPDMSELATAPISTALGIPHEVAGMELGIW